MHTFTEENYLKTIYHCTLASGSATTNQIAAATNTRAASVTDMLKKLSEKKLINYAKYQGVTLTAEGEKIAIGVIRKHRLWEYFLVEKLDFKWDEVHEVAEELEHISSIELIDRLDKFMGYPKYDPHGDPIPDSNGRFKRQELKPVSGLAVNDTGVVLGVGDHSTAFLQYLEKASLTLGTKLTVIEIIDYDHSVVLQIADKKLNISREVAKNLLVAL
ncbi:metal-dependent transcriptional regulator [Mucilaginibacter myungsuensis]|uniref:metal-dependent transcriptional regulator n=1 Tax=Mucilaginibacter myungsuensis TaxID=649104 RepID=UPI0025B2ED78|nr:metal-dependent transcriptional regulator [Mucilaginibacter myungsuensis]MDN3598001.1 metal-dependent transcriptional regulator [Mucilaginibacter myungsuensis]